MNHTATKHPALSREALIALLLALGLGGLIVLLGDLSVKNAGITVAGFLGLGIFAILPDKRIVLVCSWVLALPLSLEKKLPLFTEWRDKFMPPSLVISGADIVFFFLICYLFFENVILRRKTFFWPKVATSFALLACWAAVLFIFMDKSAPAKIQMLHWAKMVVFLALLPSCIRTRKEVMMILVAVLLALVVQVGVIGKTYVSGKKVGFSEKVTSEELMRFSDGGSSQHFRLSGTVGHVNQQAIFHTFFTLPLVGLLAVRNRVARAVVFCVICGSLVGIILTYSRTGWIACTLATMVILVVAIRSRKVGREIWIFLGGSAIVGAVLFACFGHSIMDRILKGDDGASSSRLRMASLALENAATNPVCGVGPGNFIDAKLKRTNINWIPSEWVDPSKSYSPSIVDGLELYEVEIEEKWYYFPGTVHNKFLLTVAELGGVGLIIFLWFNWQVFRTALHCMRARDPFLWWTALGLLAFFCALQVFFMLELFYDDKTVMMFLFPITLMVALERIVIRGEEERLA